MAYSKFGLQIRNGTEAAELKQSGMLTQYGNKILYDIDVELDTLEGDAKNILGFSLKTKVGAVLRSVNVVTAEAAVGGTSIDVGLEDTNGENEVDSDGFVSGLAIANMNAVGESVDGTGALIGTVMTDNGVFSVTTVGTFTAGRVKVRLEFEVL